MTNEVPVFMRRWSPRYQWLLTFLLAAISLISLVTASSFSEVFVRFIHLLIAVIFGGLSTWLAYLIPKAQQLRRIENAQLSAPILGIRRKFSERTTAVLPRPYGFCCGNIQFIPGDKLSARIGEEQYSIAANGLFYSGKLIENDFVNAVYRQNPLTPLQPLLLVIHVQRTDAIYGIGIKLHLIIATVGLVGALFNFLTTHESIWPCWVMGAFFIVVVLYVTLVLRAEKMLRSGLEV